MTTFKDWSISFVVVALLASSALSSKRSEMRFTLEPTVIRPGQRAKLRIELDIIPALRSLDATLPQPEVQDALLTEGKKWAVLDSRREVQDNKAIWVYELSSYTPGKVRLPPIEVSVGGRSYSTESMELTIKTNRVDSDFKIREGFGTLALPFIWPTWLKALIGTLLLALILIPIARWLVRKYWPAPKPKPKPAEALPPKEDPDVWLRVQLKRYRKELEIREDAYLVDDFVALLRQYFTKKFGTDARALTTRELKVAFAAEKRVTGVLPLFETCDTYRFQASPREGKEVAADCLNTAEKALLPCT